MGDEQGRMVRVVQEDRERIAAELHDRVIQRVFAVGLHLQGMSADVSEELRPRLQEAMEELDGTLRALREAIFALKRPAVSIDTAGALEELAIRASRTLGFQPEVSVHGDGTTIPRSLHEELVSTAQQALSSVMRHPGTGSVQLDLYVEGGRVRFELTDERTVLPEDPAQEPGTSEITRRAEQLGGSARWESAQPRGTRLVFEVPVDAAAPS